MDKGTEWRHFSCLFWLLELWKNDGKSWKINPWRVLGGSWEPIGSTWGLQAEIFMNFHDFGSPPGEPESTRNVKNRCHNSKFFQESLENSYRSHFFLEKCGNFLQKWPETSEDLMIFREFSSTNLTGAIAAELQGFRFNFNNFFHFFCRIRVARVVAGSRCESIESSMTSCQNCVPRFSWISHFGTKLRERGLHKRFTIRWKKTVEIHLKTWKSSKNLKKSVLEVDFPILGWFSGDFPSFSVIWRDFSGILGG